MIFDNNSDKNLIQLLTIQNQALELENKELKKRIKKYCNNKRHDPALQEEIYNRIAGAERGE